ncbi:hypothetical protein Tco_1371397 [Tanacetum coccineum]
MLAIAQLGNDAANENNAAADEAAGSAAEAHPVPHSPPVSPVREPSPERQSASERPPSLSPTPPAQTSRLAEPLVFGPAPRPAGYVDPDVLEPIIFGPQPRPYDFVDPALEEPVIFGPPPRPDNYIEPEDIDNLVSMEDDTILGGFHEESPAGPNDAPTPTADAAGRAEDPTLLTSLSAKLDRCMGRIDSLETELGTSKKIMGGAILTLVSRVKKLERTVKQLKTARFVGDAPPTEGDVDIQDDVDLEGLSRMASEALGHDQAAVPSVDMEEREEEEVPLRRKRSVYRRARTEFHTPAFAQFQTPLSADVLSPAAVSASADPSVVADKGKAHMPDLDIPAEFVAEDAQARQRFEEDQASQRLVQRLQAEDLAQEYMPNVSEERAKELDELMMRMTETDWLNLIDCKLDQSCIGTRDLRYRHVKGKPMKQSEVTQMMRTLVKKSLGVQLIKDYLDDTVQAMSKQQQRVARASSQPSNVPAATTQPAEDHDSAGGSSFHPAGSAPPLCLALLLPLLLFFPVTCHLLIAKPIDVLFEPTSGGINEFFLDSDEDEQIGMSRVAADPDSDDEIVDPRVKVETVSAYASSPPRTRRKHRGLSDSRVMITWKIIFLLFPIWVHSKMWESCALPCLVPTISHVYYQETTAKCPFANLTQLLPSCPIVDLLLLRRRMNRYFRLNPDVDVGLDLWRDVNLLCQSLHSDDVEDFWRTQDEWVVYPIRATLLERMLRHRLTVPPSYCRDVVVAGNVIHTDQALTGILRGVLHLHLCKFVFLRACTSTTNGFQLTMAHKPRKESVSPLQTALWLVQEGTALGKDLLKSVDGCQFTQNCMVMRLTVLLCVEELASPEQTAKQVKTFSNRCMACDSLPILLGVSTSPRVSSYLVKAYRIYLCCCKDWKLLLRDVAASFDSAVHEFKLCSFDLLRLLHFCCCCVVADYIVSAG